MSGSYVWPFQFTLPMGIPPSFKAMYGENHYEIMYVLLEIISGFVLLKFCFRTNVDIPFPASDKRISKTLCILAQYHSLNAGPSVQVSNKVFGYRVFFSNSFKTEDRFLGLVGSEPIRVVAATHDVAFTGEPKEIQIVRSFLVSFDVLFVL